MCHTIVGNNDIVFGMGTTDLREGYTVMYSPYH